jgi:energy-coupling factor transport system permease protein
MPTGALFGRYWEADSPVHRLDPRTKIVGTLLLVIAALCAGSFAALGFLAVCVAGFFILAKVPIHQALRSIAPLSFIIVLTALFNVFYVQGGDVYVDWGWITISQQGVYLAVFMAVRLTLLLLSGSLLTLTTTSLDITEAMERLLTPLARIGVPAHEFSLVMGIALRFLPQFASEFKTIRTAQLARGAKLATSPVKGGLAGLVSLLVPLFASAFRHADTLSSAMDARCYHGATGRTRLNPLRFARRDAIAFAVLVATLALTIVFGIL